FYEQVCYLPDALINYLLLLGWSLDDKTEFFTRQQMIDLFSLERVNKAPASFDPKKLFAFQERYMNALPLEEKVARAVPYLQRAGLVGEPLSGSERETVNRVVAEAAHRLAVAGDILSYSEFFVADEKLAYDPKALEKHVKKPPGPALLARLREI